MTTDEQRHNLFRVTRVHDDDRPDRVVVRGITEDRRLITVTMDRRDGWRLGDTFVVVRP